jgi:hypothetical protein
MFAYVIKIVVYWMLENIKAHFKSKEIFSFQMKLHRIYSDMKACKMLFLGDFWEIIFCVIS